MKRIILSFVMISLLSPTPISIATTTKAGSSCTKVGATSMVLNKKFTCVKSGKKLVWDKGVSITPTLKGSYAIAISDYISINNELNSRKPSGVEAELFISPNFNKSFIDMNTLGIYKAMDYWSDVYKPNYKLPIFFVNPVDKSWFDEVFPKRITNPTYLNVFDNQYSKQIVNFGAGDADSDQVNHENFIVFVYTSDYKPNFGSTQIGAHEYTHDVQHVFKLWNSEQQFPCWAKEGQAMLYGMVLAQPTLQDYLNVRYKFYQNTAEAKTDLPQNKPDWVQFFIKAEENKSQCARGGVYEAGALAFEYLYSLKGKQGMIDFWKALESEPTFDDAIYKTFNLKKLDLYNNFGNYIESQLTELRKNN